MRLNISSLLKASRSIVNAERKKQFEKKAWDKDQEKKMQTQLLETL